jgi:hypothetical protein
LRGVFNRQIHSSKRSLRSIEDFTEFDQRTAYFNGDQIHATKKGMNILDRVQVGHMAQMQNMLDFPSAPKLDPMTGRLDRSKATPSEVRGEEIFFGKDSAQAATRCRSTWTSRCATCTWSTTGGASRSSIRWRFSTWCCS